MRARFMASCLGLAIAAGCASAPPQQTVPGSAPATPLHVLIVGGGPDRTHNQVAIESNVRYVGRLLPLRSPYRVLFADGNAHSDDVQFRGPGGRLAYRVPDLPRLDGPSTAVSIRAEIETMAGVVRAQPSTPVLLYFTGHGSPNVRSGYADNGFDLWGGKLFSVKDLATALKAFPDSATITLVMVQCYAGAFGNVLFENGDPAGAAIDQHLAGFFAAEPQRTAAGCTPAINEAVYRDFTGYFFAALTGIDRVGGAVTGADYDRDGRVGMNEAFAYALVHDDSIDTPVSTSEAFLRRFVSQPDAGVFAHSYAEVRGWADPAQRAALDGLSQALTLAGDDRLGVALNRSRAPRLPMLGGFNATEARVNRFVDLARSVVLAHALNESGDEAVKRRFADLLRLEQGNPLR